MQEGLHRGCHVAVPDGVADEHDVILIETFYGGGNSGIITLPDGIQFLLRTVEHRVVVFLVRRFRLYHYHIAIQCGLDSLRHPLRVACAGAVKDEVSAVASLHVSTFTFIFISLIAFFPPHFLREWSVPVRLVSGRLRCKPLLSKALPAASMELKITFSYTFYFHLLILMMLQRYNGIRPGRIDISSGFVTLLLKIKEREQRQSFQYKGCPRSFNQIVVGITCTIPYRRSQCPRPSSARGRW